MATRSLTSSLIVERRAGCIAACLRVVGDKWSSLLLRDILARPRRFGELQTSLGINPRTLSQRLDNLESLAIVTKRFDDRLDAYVYEATQKGADLAPILRQMSVWGDKYCDQD